nr:single-stranded DNA-binding protein [Escherichia coli]
MPNHDRFECQTAIDSDAILHPGQVRQAVAVMPLAAKVLKQVMVNTGGNKRQVPAKRQNRGSRNSTDDGG